MIDYDLSILTTYHTLTIQKFNNIVNFWKRFYLSLPGRISIAKTLLLSQISYIGCIISPTREQFRKLSDIYEKFVKGSLNISKEKLYISPSKGGLGLIDIKNFLAAQQTVWYKHCSENVLTTGGLI